MNFKKVTGPGQINVGDDLVINTKDGVIFAPAKEVLNPGARAPEGEEIVYNRKKNHYFITNMVINGNSWVKEVYIISQD